MFYYGADLVSKQLKSGAYYDRLCPVYVICFMDFTLMHRQAPDGKIMFVYEFRERDTGERYADLMSIYLCELPRLKKRSMKQMNPVEEWFYILKRMTTFAEVPEGMDGRFAPLLETARTRQLPETEKLHYLRAMISEEEKEDIAKFYRAEGRAEGLEQGKMEVARKMKEMDLTTEQISQATGLSPQAIAAL
jgi:predicted transposase/invertase (TIGR01784 family)